MSDENTLTTCVCCVSIQTIENTCIHRVCVCVSVCVFVSQAPCNEKKMEKPFFAYIFHCVYTPVQQPSWSMKKWNPKHSQRTISEQHLKSNTPNRLACSEYKQIPLATNVPTAAESKRMDAWTKGNTQTDTRVCCVCEVPVVRAVCYQLTSTYTPNEYTQHGICFNNRSNGTVCTVFWSPDTWFSRKFITTAKLR